MMHSKRTLPNTGIKRKHCPSPELGFLKIEHPIIPTFYTLPKVHKNLETKSGKSVTVAHFKLVSMDAAQGISADQKSMSQLFCALTKM